MRTIALSEDFSDMALSRGPADGIEAIRARVVEALRFRRGGWFMNAAAGIPYLSDLAGRAPSEAIARRLLLDAALAVDGVEGASEVVFAFDQATRRMRFSFTLATVHGASRIEAAV